MKLNSEQQRAMFKDMGRGLLLDLRVTVVIIAVVALMALLFSGCEPQPTNDNAYLCFSMDKEDARAAGISCPDKNADKGEKKNDNGVICFFETKDCKK